MNKEIKIKNIRLSLKNKFSIGTWIQIPNSSLVEIIGNANFDWAAFDMEHGAIDVSQLPSLCRSLELGNTLPIARLPNDDIFLTQRVLDAGIGGLIIPNITKKTQIEKIVQYSKYPPKGRRGVGYSRSNLFGKNFMNFSKIPKNPLIIGMIESKEAISILDDLFSMHDVDAFFIGPYDLSASLGITGQFNNIIFKKTLKLIIEKSKKYKKPIGIHVIQDSKKEIQNRINQGFKFLAYSLDSFVMTKYLKRPDKL